MKIALIQMQSLVGEIDRNTKVAVEFIDKAANKGADLIVLPEYWSTGSFPLLRDYSLYKLASDEDGYAMKAIRAKAREHCIYIVATIFERDGSDLCYDTSMLIDPEGSIIGKFRKVHVGVERFIVVDGELVADLGIESIYFRTGSRFPVHRVGDWKIGIMLCYDTFFPEAARCLALRGAELIIAPFGAIDTKKTIWNELMSTRAFENITYFAACNSIGVTPTVDGEVQMGGRSLIVDPTGNIVAQASSDHEETLYADINRDELFKARRLHFMFRDRRPEAYGVIAMAIDEIPR